MSAARARDQGEDPSRPWLIGPSGTGWERDRFRLIFSLRPTAGVRRSDRASRSAGRPRPDRRLMGAAGSDAEEAVVCRDVSWSGGSRSVHISPGGPTRPAGRSSARRSPSVRRLGSAWPRLRPRASVPAVRPGWSLDRLGNPPRQRDLRREWSPTPNSVVEIGGFQANL